MKQVAEHTKCELYEYLRNQISLFPYRYIHVHMCIEKGPTVFMHKNGKGERGL